MRSIYIVSWLVCSILFSCSNQGDVLKRTDMVEIYFSDDDSVYKHQDSSRMLVDDFMKVLNGRRLKRKVQCATDGEIRFYSKGTELFIAGFSITGSECQFIMRGENAWRLTYNAGMYLSEMHYILRNEK